ncbi:hypothetical protein [Cellulosimicrobium funkei]|uniref:hypothetical protein n=1 Tax=Cellulosimicrobium funkei TaxID=264251 RepID=UPI0037DD1955
MDIDWTAVGGISTAATAVVAIWAIAAAKNDSRDRSRPVVVAEYRVPPHGHFALIFVVRNAGASVARDITVTFDPELGTPTDGQKIRPFLIERYEDPIPVLAPGQELTNSVHVDDKSQYETDLPFEVTVRIRYRRSRWRWYEDEYPLKSAVHTKETRLESSGSPAGQLKSIREALEGSRRALESISRKLPDGED